MKRGKHPASLRLQGMRGRPLSLNPWGVHETSNGYTKTDTTNVDGWVGCSNGLVSGLSKRGGSHSQVDITSARSPLHARRGCSLAPPRRGGPATPGVGGVSTLPLGPDGCCSHLEWLCADSPQVERCSLHPSIKGACPLFPPSNQRVYPGSDSGMSHGVEQTKCSVSAQNTGVPGMERQRQQRCGAQLQLPPSPSCCR